MRIQKLKVTNFRSIKSVEITPGSFSVFVGQNNHGKTNFSEAINWFFTGKGDLDKIRFDRNPSNQVEVIITLSGLRVALEKMQNKTNKKKLTNIFDEKEDEVVIRRYSGYEQGKSRQLFNPKTQKWENPIGRDSAWNDLLPKFEYVDTGTHLEDVAKYGTTTPVGSMLSGVLMTILEGNEQYEEFEEKFNALFGHQSDSEEKSQVRVKLDELGVKVAFYLQKQFPDGASVTFEVQQPELQDLLKKFQTSIHDGVLTEASEKGDGMQRALMLAIIQAYVDFRKENEETGKNFIFFIDEAELHLHPTAQRALKNALLDILPQRDQVFINTHSSVLVVDEHDEQVVFKVEKIDRKTDIEIVPQAEKSRIVFELLGGSPADLLLPRNFLIVEGTSEDAFLAKIITRFYSDKPTMQIIRAGGDTKKQEKSMEAINKAYVPLGIDNPVYKDKLVILCDKPETQKKENDIKKFLDANPSLETNGQFFLLPTESLEEYYPQPWKKNHDEVVEMDKVKNAKLTFAREVGEKITQEKFESEMSRLFNALTKCWQEAYQ